MANEVYRFRKLIHADNCQPAQVRDFLENLSAKKLALVFKVLNKRDQRTIWRLMQGFLPTNPDDLVPAFLDDLSPVYFIGKNSLIGGMDFKKGFYRSDGVIYGANSHIFDSNQLGEGYFTLLSSNNGSEVTIDYAHVPSTNTVPVNWDPAKSNNRHIVFKGLKDRLRKINHDIYIGIAEKDGKTKGYFTLLRSTPEHAIEPSHKVMERALSAMMPSIEGVPGISKKMARKYIHSLKKKSHSGFFTAFWFSCNVFNNAPDKTIGKAVRATALTPDELDTHTLAFEQHDKYSYRMMASLIRIHAALCWGSNDDIRKKFLHEDPYKQELPPKANEMAHPRHFNIARPLSPHEDSFDFIVIGTGPGGIAAAMTLVEQGRSVALIEKGVWRSTNRYPRSALGALQSNVEAFGGNTTNRGSELTLADLFSLKIHKPLWPVVQGTAVGGTTVINSAICLQPDIEVFEQWQKEGYISNAQLLYHALFDKYHGTAGKIVNEWLGVESSEQACELGDGLFEKRLIEHGLGHYTDRYTRDCAALNSCFRGCPLEPEKNLVSGKLCLDKALIPKFLALGGTLISTAKIEKINIRHGHATGVLGHFIDPLTHHKSGSLTIKAQQAILVAASVTASPLLLQASGIDNPMLGQRFQAHPGSEIIGLYPDRDKQGHDLTINDLAGPTQGWYSTDYKVEGFKLESLNSPMDLFAGRVPAAGHLLMQYLKSWRQMGVILQACRAHSTGSISGKVGKPDIDYILDEHDMKRFRQGIYRAAETHKKAGATHVMPGIVGIDTMLPVKDIKKILQASLNPLNYQGALTHLFGGCVMGYDKDNSVCDEAGKVHGTENIYVVDASVLPSNLGVNPQHTIMAMAIHIARKVADNHGGNA